MSPTETDVLRLAPGIVTGATAEFAVQRQALATTAARLGEMRDAIDGVRARVESLASSLSRVSGPPKPILPWVRVPAVTQQEILDHMTSQVGEAEARDDQVKSMKSRLTTVALSARGS